jgi:hypothetical protein
MGPIGYSETSVTINLRCVSSQNSEDFMSLLPTTMFTKLWHQRKLHLTVSRQRSNSRIWHTWVAYGKQYFVRLPWWWPIKSKLTTLELIQQVLFTDKVCIWWRTSVIFRYRYHNAIANIFLNFGACISGESQTTEGNSWGRRLARKRTSTSLGLFIHSCFLPHLWAQ